MEKAINLSRVLIRWQSFVQILIAVFISTIAVGNFIYIPESRNGSAFLIVATSLALWVANSHIQRNRLLGTFCDKCCSTSGNGGLNVCCFSMCIHNGLGQ